jgi:hypothetical protein
VVANKLSRRRRDQKSDHRNDRENEALCAFSSLQSQVDCFFFPQEWSTDGTSSPFSRLTIIDRRKDASPIRDALLTVFFGQQRIPPEHITLLPYEEADCNKTYIDLRVPSYFSASSSSSSSVNCGRGLVPVQLCMEDTLVAGTMFVYRLVAVPDEVVVSLPDQDDGPVPNIDSLSVPAEMQQRE